MAMADNRVEDQGAILINVLLIAMLMSIFMAASLALLNAPVNTFNNGLNTTQAYYNAKAGLIVGEDQIASTINASHSLGEITKVYQPKPYHLSTPSAPWSISTSIQVGNPTVSKGPPRTTTTILTFTITSTGSAGNEQSTLSTTETATVTY